jgi:hypothetical protein
VVFWRTDLVRGLPGPALRFVEQFGAASVVATGAFSLVDVTVTSGSVVSLSPKEGKSLSVYSLTIKALLGSKKCHFLLPLFGPD